MKNCFHQYGHQYCNHHYKKKKNATEFKVFQLKFLVKFDYTCDITEYCIVGLKTFYSNIKFFIVQLICILAKMVITFESVGIFSCCFRCCT